MKNSTVIQSSIVGRYQNQTTGETCTIVMLMPADYVAGSECFITSSGHSVAPIPGGDRFVDRDGDVLVAMDGLYH